jgi:sugar lactone lactonase YvrE
MLEYSLFDLSTFVTAVVPPTATITITTDPANGRFKEGDTGDTITAAVMNTSSTVPLPANTTFTITLPAGVTATAMTDSTGGWSCTVSTLTCTRSTTLAASTSDSVIVTVSVSSTATGGEMSITGMVTAQVASPNFSSNVSSPITITLVQAAAVSWATPAAITYGTALSGTQFDAVGNAPSGNGTYAYTPLVGVVLSAGSQTLSVVYTPGSTYTSTYPGTGTASVTLVVNPAAATVTLSGLTRSYTGSPAAVSSTTNPASLLVTYTYTGINPTIYGPSSTAPAAAGSYTVVATIASGQNYAGTASGTLVISASTPDATSTSVQISPSPVMAGQPVTITATIADTTNPGTIPTGSVIFTDTTTSTVLNGGGAVTVNGSGAAVLTGVILDGAGAHTISAAYSGVESIASSTNTAQVQVGLSSLVATPLVSYPVTVTITAAGTPANISVVTEGATGLDFTDAVMGDTCISNPPTGGRTCTVNVNFTPKYAGPRYGAVVITSVGGDVLGTAYLQGTGTGSEVTFNPGTQSTLPSSADGVAFNQADGVAVDSSRSVYVADNFNFRIVKIPWTGSGYGTPVAIPLSGQSFNYAEGVAVDGAGNLLVLSFAELVELPWNGSSYGTAVELLGSLNGGGVAVDGAGNVYASDYIANTVTEVPRTANGYGSASVLFSGLNSPQGLAVDGAGNIYVVNQGVNTVLEMPWTGSGYGSPITVSSSLSAPGGVAVDAAGDVYIADINNLRAVVVPRTSSGFGAQAVLPITGVTPVSIASDELGNVFVTSSSAVVELDVSDTPSLSFASTTLGATSSDSPRTVTVSNVGNAPMTFTGLSYPGDFPELSGASGACSTSAQLAAGTGCTLPLNFTPTSTTGPLSESLMLTDNNLNATVAPATQQTIALSGTAFAAVAATQEVATTVLTQNHAATSFTPVIGSGGLAPLSYSVFPGLPAGLVLNTSTGAIAGTPTGTIAASSYTVTVTDANAATATANFSLTVNAAVAATQAVASTVLTQNHAATTFTPVTGSGGTAPLTYSVSPGLPTGLMFDPSTGAMTGTSTVAGAAVGYTVTVTDTNGATATANFGLTVNAAVAATRAVASTVLTQNHAATTFTPVTGMGGTVPLAYSMAPGLPPGLTFNASTGAITGTPTVASAASTYTVTVTDANGATAMASFNLTVDSAVVATQTIASTTLTQNRAAVGFMPVAGSGGDAPLTYSVAPGLPAGLVFNTSMGAITGTPTSTSAASSYTVTVTDANGATATASFSLTVNVAVAATQAVASTVLTANHAATTFTPVTGAGGTAPLTYSVSPGLPAGLVLNAITGAITGMPTSASAALSYTVTVTDANGATATANFSLTVDSVVLAVQAIRAKELTFYQVTAPFKPVTGSGGTAPLTYSVLPLLPAGLVLNTSTGVISGTPAVVSAAASYMVTVTDTNGETAQASFSLGAAQQASMTAVSANPTTATPVQSVTLSATVASTLAGTPMTPSGTMTFFNGSTQLGVAVPLAGGTAQLVVPSLPPGQTAMITAVYSGDGNFLGGTSGNSASVVVAPLDFTFTNAGTNGYTAAPGAVASYNFALAPLYSSYAGLVSFTVTGLPAGATASFTPSSVAADGGSVPVQMTVQMPSTLAHNGKSGNSPFGRGIVLALLLLPFGMKRRVREKLKGRMLLLVLLLAGATAAVSGCASNNGFMLQSPRTYTLTVTATSGTLQHSQTVTLTVQ